MVVLVGQSLLKVIIIVLKYVAGYNGSNASYISLCFVWPTYLSRSVATGTVTLRGCYLENNTGVILLSVCKSQFSSGNSGVTQVSGSYSLVTN